jgi:hypothetical protein
MAEGRTRKTGQHDQQLIRALAESTEAKRTVAELVRRVEKLEAEVALLRGQLSATIPSTPPAARRAGPPPLPPSPSAPPRRTSGKHQPFIDISEMAELVDPADSIPPPRRK